MPRSAKLIIANYYNKYMNWNHGNLEGVANLKNPMGHEKALVIDYEVRAAAKIQAYPWQTDTNLGGWSYDAEYPGKQDATWVIKSLSSNAARNGNLLLNLTLRADGSLPAYLVTVCEGVGAWLTKNGEAIYGSRPFERDQEGETYFTRNDGFVYATTFTWPQGGKLVLESLRKGGSTLGTVRKVELLGHGPCTFRQDVKSLAIVCHKQPDKIGGVNAFVFKVTQDKLWINDDDPGVKYVGWDHTCNLDQGEFNNDVHSSKTPGAVCEYTFTGSGIELIGTKDAGFGSVEVAIDGPMAETVSDDRCGASRTDRSVQKRWISKRPAFHQNRAQGRALANIDAFIVIRDDASHKIKVADSENLQTFISLHHP